MTTRELIRATITRKIQFLPMNSPSTLPTWPFASTSTVSATRVANASPEIRAKLPPVVVPWGVVHWQVVWVELDRFPRV